MLSDFYLIAGLCQSVSLPPFGDLSMFGELAVEQLLVEAILIYLFRLNVLLEWEWMEFGNWKSFKGIIPGK